MAPLDLLSYAMIGAIVALGTKALLLWTELYVMLRRHEARYRLGHQWWCDGGPHCLCGSERRTIQLVARRAIGIQETQPE